MQAHALLYGPQTNFCLALNYQFDVDQAYNQLWSANMSNLVLVQDDIILLYNIKLGKEPQIISYPSVMRDLNKFSGYLKSISLSEDNTIVPFVMSHFREPEGAGPTREGGSRRR